MRMIIDCLEQQGMVISHSLNWDVGFADVPELHEVVMACHQVVLLVGIVVYISNIVLRLWTDFEGILLTELRRSYVLVALS